MKKPNLIAAAGTVVLAGLTTAPALAAAKAPKVSVQVEGLSATVLPAKTVTVPSTGSITQGGVKAGACPADSVQGALNVATGGKWKGTWYASYKEYEITSILGNTPNAKKDYFEIFVNHVAATAGACDIGLKAGDSLLFAAVPDSGAAQTPLGVTWKASGKTLTATVVAYSATGKPAALKGATVKLGSQTAKTGAKGSATLTAPTKPTTLVASAAGHIRDETTVAAASSAA